MAIVISDQGYSETRFFGQDSFKRETLKRDNISLASDKYAALGGAGHGEVHGGVASPEGGDRQHGVEAADEGGPPGGVQGGPPGYRG